jgi:hypothetical protein
LNDIRGLGCADEKFPSVAARTSGASDFIRATVCTISSSPPDYLKCEDPPVDEESAEVSSGVMVPVIISIVLPESTDDVLWAIMQGERVNFQSPALSRESDEIWKALFLEHSQQYAFSLITNKEHPGSEKIRYSITALREEGQTIVLLEGSRSEERRTFEVAFANSNCIGSGGKCTFSDSCCIGRCVRGYCRRSYLR